VLAARTRVHASRRLLIRGRMIRLRDTKCGQRKAFVVDASPPDFSRRCLPHTFIIAAAAISLIFFFISSGCRRRRMIFSAISRRYAATLDFAADTVDFHRPVTLDVAADA